MKLIEVVNQYNGKIHGIERERPCGKIVDITLFCGRSIAYQEQDKYERRDGTAEDMTCKKCRERYDKHFKDRGEK
jgi:hypothetical protein